MKNFILAAILLGAVAVAKAGDIVSKGADNGISVSTASLDNLCVNSGASGYGTCGTMKAGFSTGYNVGIGKQNPSTALDVNGTITATAIAASAISANTITSSLTVTGAGGLGVTYAISGGSIAIAGSTFTVTSAGMVNAPGQPFVSVPMGASVIAGVDSTMFFTTPAAGDDNWNMWGGASSSGTFTIPVGGTGRWTLQVTGSMQSASALIESIYVNGAAVALQQINSDGNTHDFPMTRTFKLTAGDIIKFTMLQNSGSNKNTVGNVITRSFAMIKKD